MFIYTHVCICIYIQKCVYISIFSYISICTYTCSYRAGRADAAARQRTRIRTRVSGDVRGSQPIRVPASAVAVGCIVIYSAVQRPHCSILRRCGTPALRNTAQARTMRPGSGQMWARRGQMWAQVRGFPRYTGVLSGTLGTLGYSGYSGVLYGVIWGNMGYSGVFCGPLWYSGGTLGTLGYSGVLWGT